jgi:Uma2 family endonuclease
MEIMASAQHHARPPTGSRSDGRDQVVVLRGISWEHYDAIQHAKGEAPRPLLAYLDGELEIVTTSKRHEFVKTMLARVVETFAEVNELRLNGYGMATIRKQAQRAGAEPDEWYFTQKGGERPDLAIEVVFTSGGVDKLEIYRRLQVPEVWFWIDNQIWIYRLVDDVYEERAVSVELPGIDLRAIERLIATADEDEQTEAIAAYRRTLNRR